MYTGCEDSTEAMNSTYSGGFQRSLAHITTTSLASAHKYAGLFSAYLGSSHRPVIHEESSSKCQESAHPTEYYYVFLKVSLQMPLRRSQLKMHMGKVKG